MRNRLPVTALLLICGLSPAFAAGAPPALRDHTVVIGWTADNTLRAASGRVFQRSTNVRRQIYISSAGRVFVRFSGRSGTVAQTDEAGPEDHRVSGGGVRQTSFVDNQMIASTAFESGAAQIVVSFASGFSICTVDVTFGRAGTAPIRRRGLNGQKYELIKSDISAKSCAIQVGNVFAN